MHIYLSPETIEEIKRLFVEVAIGAAVGLAIISCVVLAFIFGLVLLDPEKRKTLIDRLFRRKTLTLASLEHVFRPQLLDAYSIASKGTNDVMLAHETFAKGIGVLPSTFTGDVPSHLGLVIDKKMLWEVKRKSGGLQFHRGKRIPQISQDDLFRPLQANEVDAFQSFCREQRLTL